MAYGKQPMIHWPSTGLLSTLVGEVVGRHTHCTRLHPCQGLAPHTLSRVRDYVERIWRGRFGWMIWRRRPGLSFFILRRFKIQHVTRRRCMRKRAADNHPEPRRCWLRRYHQFQPPRCGFGGPTAPLIGCWCATLVSSWCIPASTRPGLSNPVQDTIISPGKCLSPSETGE